MKINWFSLGACIALAALFPDLPLLAGRIFGYQSHLPMILTVIMAAVSGMYLLAYTVGNVSSGRWLASAWAATSLIGVISGVLAAFAMIGMFSPNFYNIFRDFPAHVIQTAVMIFIILHAVDTSPAKSFDGIS